MSGRVGWVAVVLLLLVGAASGPAAAASCGWVRCMEVWAVRELPKYATAECMDAPEYNPPRVKLRHPSHGVLMTFAYCNCSSSAPPEDGVWPGDVDTGDKQCNEGCEREFKCAPGVCGMTMGDRTMSFGAFMNTGSQCSPGGGPPKPPQEPDPVCDSATGICYDKGGGNPRFCTTPTEESPERVCVDMEPRKNCGAGDFSAICIGNPSPDPPDPPIERDGNPPELPEPNIKSDFTTKPPRPDGPDEIKVYGPGQPWCGVPGKPPCPKCGVPGKPPCDQDDEPACGVAGKPQCTEDNQPECGVVGRPACVGDPPTSGNGGPGGLDACGGPAQPPCPPKCGNAGQPPCVTCGGPGQPACTTCGGPGQPACSSCGGVGQPACSTCGGFDQPPCSQCGGPGQPECTECGGSGQPACAECGVPGKPTCGDAGGGGTCGAAPVCSGDAIACNVLFQSWQTRCAVEALSGTGTPGDGDFPTADGSKLWGVSINPADAPLDDRGFLGLPGGGQCPDMGTLEFMGEAYAINDWLPCEALRVLAALILAGGFIQAAFIIGRA